MPLPAPAPSIALAHLKTRQLRLVVQLREDGSLLHAAESLGMSQSAASKLLGQLEETVGLPLFERHARGVEPTPYGRIFSRRAKAALAEMSRAADEMEDFRRGSRAPVSIGSLLSPCSTFLPAALMQLARSPEILVNVHVDTSRALIDGLMEARFDLVLARVRDASLEPELDFEPVVTEPIGVVARAGHPLARKRSLVLADLVTHPWILPPRGSDLRTRIDALCIQQGLPLLTSMLETLSVAAMLGVLRASDALVLLPEEFARAYCGSGGFTLLKIHLGVRSEVFGMITRRNRDKSPQLQKALEAFRACAAAMYGRGSRRPAP